MAVRIQDIAQELNLSSMTVSRVLNRSEGTRIAAETEARVLQAAARMGYRPNRHARALATGRTHTVAIWISHLHSSVYTQIARCCREEVEQAGFQAAVLEMHWHFAAPAVPPRLDWQVDGILAVDPPAADTLESILGETPLSQVPRVHLGSGQAVEWAGDYVRVDLRAGTRAAIDHLVRAGCRRVAYALPEGADRPGSGNYDAYCQAVRAAGLAPELILSDARDMASVRQAVRRHLLSSGTPDGIYCHNDEIAIAAFRAVRDLGLRVPDDVLLIGCEGNEFMEYFDPPLSTVFMQIPQMCRSAWRLLHRRLGSAEAPAEQLLLPPQLVLRESSAFSGKQAK